MSRSNKDKGEELKENGWYEVDILDMRIISYVFGNEVSRRDVKEKFGITEEKSRSRLEKLADKGIIEKKTVCRRCDNRISECECGSYSKKILYFQDEEENMIELRILMDEMGEILNI